MAGAARPDFLVPRRAWRRFLRRRTACGGLALLTTMGVVSLVTLPVTWAWHDVQALTSAVRHPPALRPVVDLDAFRASSVESHRAGTGVPLLLSGDSSDPLASGQAPISPGEPRTPARANPGKTVTVRDDAPVGASWMQRALHAASSWLGHDDLGRSLFLRLLPGFLVSLGIGLGAAMMALFIGTTWGAAAGLLGGRADAVLMRVVDVLYGLPYILMVILLKVALTRPLTALLGDRSAAANLVILLLAIGGVSWLTLARVVRGQVLSLREMPFVEAARVAGAGSFYLFRRHILPHLLGPIVVYTALIVPQAILQESFLSFLGIGVQQPTPSLGRLASEGVEAVNTFVGFWWLLAFPCGTLVITLLALNFVSDGLRDALDPRSRDATLV